jgi:hypothetical protein
MSPAGLLLARVAPERVREAVAEVLGRGEYQGQLPGAVEPFRLDLPELGPWGKLGTFLAWTALAVLAATLVTWLVRRLAGWNRDAPIGEGAAASRAAPEIPVAGAEALAGQGRFGEAIHALLLETLQALSRAERLPRSYTSREVLARVPLPAGARAALEGLVGAVEVSWFGGDVPGEADYRGCLARFHAFREAYRSGA